MDLFGLYGMVGFFYRLNMQEHAENICYGSGMKVKSWDQENLIYIYIYIMERAASQRYHSKTSWDDLGHNY